MKEPTLLVIPQRTLWCNWMISQAVHQEHQTIAWGGVVYTHWMAKGPQPVGIHSYNVQRNHHHVPRNVEEFEPTFFCVFLVIVFLGIIAGTPFRVDLKNYTKWNYSTQNPSILDTLQQKTNTWYDPNQLPTNMDLIENGVPSNLMDCFHFPS